MMIIMIKMISTAFFFLSLFTILGSQARIIPGKHGMFEIISSINLKFNQEKKWISVVAEQVTLSNIMSTYGLTPKSPPPAPGSAPTRQPGMSEKPRPYKIPKSPPPPPPHSAPSRQPGMSTKPRPYKIPKSPPPSPCTSLKSKMISDYANILKSPPPPPDTSPTRGHISLITNADTSKSPPPPRDIYLDCEQNDC